MSGVLTPETKERSVTWDDGKLEGDPFLVEAFQRADKRFTGWLIGPPQGPATSRNHLSSGLSTLYLADRVFLGPFQTTGGVPSYSTGAEQE